MIKKVLTIAGSDCSGGAGIQADLKTITAHKMYGMSVITALTAQNTTGVYAIREVDAEMIGAQLDCIFTDIVPDAVKIGMVANDKIIRIIAAKLIEYQAKNIVVDPVMVATSGAMLLEEKAQKALVEELFPLATVITPNILEASCLSGIKIDCGEKMCEAAKVLAQNNAGTAILIKGGHLDFDGFANDLLWRDGIQWISTRRVANPNTHGTGCTLSSAIACNLAAGQELSTAIRDAKKYLTGAIESGLDLGNGAGPLDHAYGISRASPPHSRNLSIKNY